MKNYLKTYHRLLLMLLTLCWLSGCVSYQKSDNTSLVSTMNTATRLYQEKDKTNNAFFLVAQGMNYTATYTQDGGITYHTKNIRLNITPVSSDKNGIFYKMDSKDKLPVGGLPVFFYVQSDKIYRILATQELRKFNINTNAYSLVFQNENLHDSLNTFETGIHHFILKKPESCESRLFQVINDNIDSMGPYETYYWEKGVGLSQYRTGIMGKENLTLNKQEKNDSVSGKLKNNFFRAGRDVHYKLEYLDDYYVKRDIYVDFNRIAEYKNGILYEMSTKETLPIKRFPLYLYVEKNKIYRIWYTNDELKDIKSEKKLLKDATLICGDKGLPDKLMKNESGEHNIISEDGNSRESHFYNVNENGDMSGYWESFLWKKDKGLMHYRGGFDAEAQMIELTRIEE